MHSLVMDSIVNILLIFSFITSFPIELQQQNGFYSPIKLKNATNLTTTTLLLLIFAWSFYKQLSPNNIDILNVSITVTKVLIALRLMTIVVTKRFKIATFLNEMKSIEATFAGMNVHLTHKPAKNYAVFYMTMLVTFSSVAMTMTLIQCDASIDECLATLVAQNINYTIVSAMVLQMSIFAYWIYERVRVINATLTRMIVPDCIEIFYPALDLENRPNPKKESKASILFRLSIWHYDLVELANLLDDIYGEGVLYLLIMLCIDSVLVFYTMFKLNSVAAVFKTCWFDLSRVVTLFFEITSVVIPCSSVKRVVRRTSEIINILPKARIKHLVVTGTTDFHEKWIVFEKEMFLLQNQHHRVVFTVKGFFPLDETVYLMILATITSYFIIVIQFEQTYHNAG